jgi:hypothetical protein
MKATGAAHENGKIPTTGPVVDLFGPTVEFLTAPDDQRNDFCVLQGTIPPGASIPLHSHPDKEDFVVLSGSMEGLQGDAEVYKWIGAKAGDYVHVPRRRTARLAKRLRSTCRQPDCHDQEAGAILSGGGKTGDGRAAARDARGTRTVRGPKRQIGLLERHA